MKAVLTKNKTLVMIVGMLLIAGIAFGAGMAIKNATATSDAYIGIEKARSIALEDAGLKAADVTFTSAHLDKDDRVPNYDIEFDTKTKEYSYEIDATNGTILDKSIERLDDDDVARNNKDGNSNSTNNNSSNNSGNTNNSNGSSSNSGSSGQSVNSYIGVSKAKSIALNHAGVSAGSVTFTKAYLDSDDGIKVYEIEFKSNTREYEYEINARTGAIMDYDIEAREYDDDDDDD